MTRKWTIETEQVGQRLDRFLAQQNEDISRSQISRLIESGHILLNGTKVTKNGQKLRRQDQITLTLPPVEVVELLSEPIPLEVVYQDDDLLVVDKQPDLVVHPAHGHPSGTLVNALLYHIEGLQPIHGVVRPGIVHRIDRQTSGLLVVAKTETALRKLSEAIKEHRVERSYLAVVKGSKLAEHGSWDTLIGRHPRDRKRFSCQVRSGKRAVTHWRVLERSQICCLADVSLETGRTHQIRVHFCEHGHGLIGDPVYGRKLQRSVSQRYPEEYRACGAMKRQALHAYRLSFEHPTRSERICCYARPPKDILELIETLFGEEALSFIPDEPVVIEPLSPTEER